MVVIGAAMISLAFRQAVRIIVDGESQRVTSFALTPAGALRDADITLQDEDQVIPELDTVLFKPNIIRINRAQPIQIVSGQANHTLTSTERLPANLLQAAGYVLFPKDLILWNGTPIDPSKPLPAGQSILLQFKPAQAITLSIDGQISTIHSNQSTLGMALHEAGIQLNPKDVLSLDLDTPVTSPLAVSIRRARLLSIAVDSQTVTGFSASETVGEVLSEMDLVLQDLDYSQPAEDAPVPENGNIQIVRVREALLLQKEEFAYKNTYAPDPETELDQTSVIQPGRVGLIIHRERVRYENGEEVTRWDDGSWQASDPQDGILGYGTKVVVRSEVVDGQSIEYWRKISVYASSYSPCKQGYSYCSTGTASGITLEKGVVAVLVSWYRAMKFQQVYIPGYGYGTIADTGGGVPGRPWIDLGFSEDNYESWHSWTTLYFLTPVPGYIPYPLP